MKSFISFLVLFSTYCYCERLLGGWSTTNDHFLKKDCLNLALDHIHGTKVSEEIRSKASDLICKTQVVNGLNIKCTFIINGQKWRCSYYKSFIQTLEVQLEQCKRVEQEEEQEQKKVEQEVPEQKKVEQEIPEQKKDEHEVVEQKKEEHEVEEQKEGEQDDEELGRVNEGEKENQPLKTNENEDEEQPGLANKGEKVEQVAQESLIANENEEDDEAKIDAMNKQMSDQNANNEEEEQQQ